MIKSKALNWTKSLKEYGLNPLEWNLWMTFDNKQVQKPTLIHKHEPMIRLSGEINISETNGQHHIYWKQLTMCSLF